VSNQKNVDDRLADLTSAAADLVAALDRMYGGETLSMNASAARDRLRRLLPSTRDPQDERPKILAP